MTVGCSRTSGLKFQAGMAQQTTSVSALTVAVRSPPGEQRDLAEVIAGPERRAARAVLRDRERAGLDEEEADAALALRDDLIARRERAAPHARGDAAQVLVGHVREQLTPRRNS